MNKLERLAIGRLNHAVENFDQKSAMAKVTRILEKIVVCAPSGMSPHKVQHKLAKEAGMKPATQTIYSAGLGLVAGFGRYLLGDHFENFDILNLPDLISNHKGFSNAGTFLKYWGVYSFTDASIRFLYANLSKKPLGTLLWELTYSTKESLVDPLLEKTKGRFLNNRNF